jgi:hypothetical protein
MALRRSHEIYGGDRDSYCACDTLEALGLVVNRINLAITGTSFCSITLLLLWLDVRLLKPLQKKVDVAQVDVFLG